MDRPVYLDYNATTPVDPAVLDCMLPFLRREFGNASSAHPYGYAAQEAVSRARAHVADVIGASPDEIIFTGGGSESDNLALKGVVLARLQGRPHVVASTVEHPAVLNTLSYLQRRFNVAITLVPVDVAGRVDLDALRSALRPETVLITIMHANNETGTLQPIEDIATIAREGNVLFHVDAAQSAGKIPIDASAVGVDLLTIAGHKLYAPKGVGALYVRRGVELDPLVHGSGQEHRMRAGTENVAGIVALGEAARAARSHLAEETVRLTGLRDCLHTLLAKGVPGLQLNGHATARLPNTLNVSFPHVLGQTVLACTPEVAASTGSACHSGLTEPSPVLMAMGLPAERALGAVRLSLGRWTTEEEVERAASGLIRGFEEARSLSP